MPPTPSAELRLRLPRSLPLLLALFYLVHGLLLRLLLWGAFGAEGGVGLADLPTVLAVGLGRDLQLGLALVLPLALYLDLQPRSWLSREWQRALLLGSTWLFLVGLLYLGVVEFYFFEEFSSRLDLVAVDYLIYPTEVFGDIWASYPVLPTLLASMAAAALSTWVARRAVAESLACARTRRDLRRSAALALAAFALPLLLGMTGGESSASTNRVAAQLADNGVRTFLLAARTSEIDYHAYYRSGDLAPLRARLRSTLDPARPFDPSDASWQRDFRPPPDVPERRPNIVLILQESFGAEFVGAYGDDRGLTPAFDRLAEKSLLFRNAYATGTRTVRGIEAVLTSLPPIPTVSVVRRPGCEGMANLGATLRGFGYATSFHYGGYSYFDNMFRFFAGNGFAVHDRGDLPAPRFANIWGVSDEDLFDSALGHFDTLAREERPFFGVILTTSNHKPFTFPEGIPGIPAEGGGRLAGVRYADYAMGRFFERLPRHAWSADTLFVVLADHGARVYGSAQIPLESYRIPLLFYWPGVIAPGVVEEPVSQIDVAPTLLGRLGRAYRAPFFGRDVLAPGHGPALLPFHHNHDVGLLVGDRLTILGLQRSVDAFRYRPGEESYQPIDAEPDAIDLTVALYQTADDLFHRRAYR